MTRRPRRSTAAPNGILKAKLAGKLVIDMSTIRPDTMKSIGTAVAQQGAAFVECPVGGSTVPAKEGKLFGLVGGSKADVARAMPLLEQLCRRIEHVGDTRRRRDDEACGQSAAAGLLAGARRGPDHLQAAQSSRRPADRYPVRHLRRADRHERTRRQSSPRCWAARRSARPRSASPPRKRISPRAVQFAASIHAELPVTASALACFEEAEAAGLGDADATTVSIRWTQRTAPNPESSTRSSHPKQPTQQQSNFNDRSQEPLWPHRRPYPRRRRPRPAAVLHHDRHSRPHRGAPGRQAGAAACRSSAGFRWRILPMPPPRKSMRSRKRTSARS